MSSAGAHTPIREVIKMSQSSIQQGLRAAQAAAPTPPPTLVFLPSGDVRCGWCGRGADPGEDSHAAHDFRDRPGCGVTWTHVVGIGEAAVEQARRSRPDLTYLDPNIQGRAYDQAVTASHLHAEVGYVDADGWTLLPDGRWHGPAIAECPGGAAVGYEECGQDGCPCQAGAASRLDPDTPLDALPDDYGAVAIHDHRQSPPTLAAIDADRRKSTA